jgi:hypothetical protein
LSEGTCLQKTGDAVCEVQNAFGILFGMLFQTILKDNVKMYVMATKIVPCLLGELQKEIHVSTCQDIPERVKRDPQFFLKIVTDEETWIYACDPATNPHLSGRASSPVH